MAGKWCEHFQEYANDAELLDGVFAETGGWSIKSANPPRAGASYVENTPEAFASRLRRIFGGPTAGAGYGFRYYVATLPELDGSENNFTGTMPIGFMAATGHVQVAAFLGSDGGLVIYRGGAGTGDYVLLGRAAPCITARTYQYIEAKCVPDPAAGTFEIRVNGATVFNYTGDTDPLALGEVSQMFTQGSNLTERVADLHAWDTEAGNGPTDFVGNVAVLRRALNADTAQADWALSAGATGYTLLTDKSDASFIEADTAGLKSAFDAAALPAGTVGIIYQQVKFRGLKTDAADCDVAASLLSAGNETGVNGQAMTAFETWRWSIFADDPATAAPWTLTAANASEPAITRTA